MPTPIQATMTFPGGNQSGRAVSLVHWKSDFILAPLWLSRAAFEFIPSASGVAVSGVAIPTAPQMRPGFVGAASDGAGNAWLLGYTGPVTFMPVSGVGTLFPLPSGATNEIFAAAAYQGSAPYFGATSGNLYTDSAGAIVKVTGGFGEITRDVVSDGTKLYGALPGVSGVSHLGVFTFASPTSGSVTKFVSPIPFLSAMAASSSGVAIAGWQNSTVGSGAASLVMGSSGFAAFANTSANAIQLLSGIDPGWTVSAPVSGTGAPVDLVWSTNVTQLLATDPTNSNVQVFNLTAGALVSAQVLSVSGAAKIGMTPTTGAALVTQPSHSLVSVLTSSAGIWSDVGTVSGVTASAILVLSDTEAVVGSPSGITFLEFVSANWHLGLVVSGLAFTPSSLSTDSSGTIFAAGTAGVSGHVAVMSKTGIGPQAAWAGSAAGVLYRQGQIAVADASNSLIRVFGRIGVNLSQSGIAPAPAGADYIGQTGVSVWLCGSGAVWQTRFTAPYRLVPYVNGLLSFFNGSTFSTINLGVENQPSALTWGPSGIWAATVQDQMFVVSPSGTILVQQNIRPANPQLAGTPLGMAALLFHDGGLLFAASSMNNGLISIVPASASG